MKLYIFEVVFSDNFTHSFQISEDDSLRLSSMMNACNNAQRVFRFTTIGGRLCAVNLDYAKTVKFSFKLESYQFKSTNISKGLSIYLTGKNKPLQIANENGEQLFEFFDELETGCANSSFPGIRDEDGNLVHINLGMIQCAVASEATFL